MTFAGFIDRGIFNFGDETLTLPTTVDWSIIATTLVSWYYCTYRVTYIPKDPKRAFVDQEAEATKKYDEVTRDA